MEQVEILWRSFVGVIAAAFGFGRQSAAPNKQTNSSPIKEISEFEKLHFDSKSIKVDRDQIDVRSILGIDLSDDEIIGLSGAHSNSTVKLAIRTRAYWKTAGTGVDAPPPGLYFYVTGPLLAQPQAIGIYFLPAKTPALYIKDVFFEKSAPPGIAGRMLVRIVRTAMTFGIKEINLLAAGGRTWPNATANIRWDGYGAWPVYGFDMPLESKTKSMFPHFSYHPSQLATCYTVSEVLDLEGGPDFWRVVGDGWFMKFDCSHDQTDSVRRLVQKVQAKGV